MCWRLLNNRKATIVEEAKELIEWYRACWEIEVFFHVFKTGCGVESLQRAILPKTERALALFVVMSWRIARLMRRGCNCPDSPASLLFDPDEIKAAYVLTQKPLLVLAPRLDEMGRRVAMLGGFPARKGDGEPGVKTIWLGQKVSRGLCGGSALHARDGRRGKLCVMQWGDPQGDCAKPQIESVMQIDA